ncbi:hypothetical protein HNE67_004666 [Salmonella enterica]|uniref:Uncharacterized protein n=1 Tax=Salmonella enterica TaxID=28901 RepID=A0A5Z2BG89_SALER|nr:hypothetical protein [Salmonella enterica]EDN4981432.1 hypothetical protein [Salmonella enterica subsp. enterica serovar Javiana]EDO5270059.1 hypothetical protein [Salmonella enterica subsp. enterica serovar Paratyphi B]EEN9496016.1 hypothetical protein [Salmonella enterica subsp. enterica serovar Anatum]HBJ6397806.1 hypothetical protein [Salmonella enterica subsp. enterica serovar Miami]EAM1693016.1 hypothetical protein [Salmonella enterica]
MSSRENSTFQDKKALSNQSFNTGLSLTAIIPNPSRAAEGTPSFDVDISIVLFLRQYCACGPSYSNGEKQMWRFLERYMDAPWHKKLSIIILLILCSPFAIYNLLKILY